MVTVTGFKTVVTDDGDSYVRLVLQGGLEMVKSENSGNFYAHRKRATISSTFDEVSAKEMIGQQIGGSIIRQDVEPYEFQLDNGEVIKLTHRWVYTDQSHEELAINQMVDQANANTNGTAQLAEVAL